jgi:hypothetical protein
MFSRGWFLVSLLLFGAGVDIIMYCLAFRFIVSFLPDFAYLAMEEKIDDQMLQDNHIGSGSSPLED